MSSGRDLVSRVRSLNKLLSSDNNITDRVIFKELKSVAALLIKRETNLRRLWTSPNIFTTIDCVAMETVPLSECCDYKSKCNIARSTKEIPQISEGIFGLLIQSVFSAGMKKFDYATVDRFTNMLKIGLPSTKNYFWVSNNRIYITDPDIENITIIAHFDADINPNDFSECPKKENNVQACMNPLDKPFSIPSYLEDSLVSMVNDVLSKTYFRHQVDAVPDKRDTNV